MGKVKKITGPVEPEPVKLRNARVKKKPTMLSRILTRKEMDVFQLRLKGLNSTDIARILEMSNRTAQNHSYHILKKTGCKTMQEVFQLAVEENNRKKSSEDE